VLIVFIVVIDPVGSGLVASMSRPGGNVTGFVAFEYPLVAKWFELLKEIAPGVTRAPVLRDPITAAGIGQFAAIQIVGRAGMELSAIDLNDASEIERAIAAFARGSNGAERIIVRARPLSQIRESHFRFRPLVRYPGVSVSIPCMR
jgi:putative tryptophan/tyrosine transport system substrate-binding protein